MSWVFSHSFEHCRVLRTSTPSFSARYGRTISESAFPRLRRLISHLSPPPPHHLTTVDGDARNDWPTRTRRAVVVSAGDAIHHTCPPGTPPRVRILCCEVLAGVDGTGPAISFDHDYRGVSLLFFRWWRTLPERAAHNLVYLGKPAHLGSLHELVCSTVPNRYPDAALHTAVPEPQRDQARF